MFDVFQFIGWVLYATGIGIQAIRRAIGSVLDFWDETTPEQDNTDTTPKEISNENV